MEKENLNNPISGNDEFMKLIESEESHTVEMMDRLVCAQEFACEVGRELASLDSVVKELRCPYNEIALDAMKLSLNQFNTDILLRMELILAKDLSAFNRMTLSDKLKIRKAQMDKEIQNEK